MFVRLIVLMAALVCGAVHAADNGANPRVVLETSEGSITIELAAKEAPVSVANFLDYVKAGFYNGTVFHRVIPNFMIQGGGFTPTLEQKETHGTIKNEAANGLKNERGTLAMARRAEPDSATAQFFINLTANDFLDHQGEAPAAFGYAVFGRVTEGMDVVDKIAATTTTSVGPMSDVPAQPIVIKSATLLAP
ncbi:MAG: peptidyl-prolyl cis-trans isomerase [Proteobacteria bacterium]|nr:peptidyl-prolyl cis-trans isomerase [Pseudomonadota bacterium]